MPGTGTGRTPGHGRQRALSSLAELCVRGAASILRDPSQFVIAGQSLLLFSAAEICVRATTLTRSARLFGSRLEFTDREPGRERLQLSAHEARRLAMLDRLARIWPFGARGACLRHSLAAGYVLRARCPVLRLAVAAAENGKIAAHAWLEVGGRAATDPGLAYLPLIQTRRGLGSRTAE